MSRWAGESAVALLDRCGLLRMKIRNRAGLRVVCYHGVCSDETAREPWVPEYFVTAGQFAEQMTILSNLGRVVHLPEEFDAETGPWPSSQPCFAITFDDVAACAFQYARPILERFGYRASFFIATGHASTARLFDANVLELLQWRPELAGGAIGAGLHRLLEHPAEHKRMAIAELRRALDEVEQHVRRNAPADVVEALRPMNWEQIRTLANDGHAIGGHTVDHAILGSQDQVTRRFQIVKCMRDLRDHLPRRPAGFAYPNGGPGDFGDADYGVLTECGFRYAASTRPGFCDRGTDPYDLPRVCIGLGHTPEKFMMELSGLLDGRRHRQQGWR